MHEVSLIKGIFQNLKQNFDDEQLSHLVGVKLRVGKMSTAEPCLMEHAFEAAKVVSGELTQAKLKIEVSPLVVMCSQCGEQSEINDYRLVCKTCKSTATNIISGLELEIVELEFLDSTD